MSLRAFHIVFVTVSTLLCLFFAVWAFGFSRESGAIITVLGVVGVIGSLGMPVYGVFFYRKARNILL